MKNDESLLDDLAPKKRVKRAKKKFHSTKGATLDIALRRQVAADLGEDEPTKDQRYVLLQKFGVVSPKIDRLATKPNWMSIAEWKRKQNEWYKATRGMIQPQQQKMYGQNQRYGGKNVRVFNRSIPNKVSTHEGGKMVMPVRMRSEGVRHRGQPPFGKNS